MALSESAVVGRLHKLFPTGIVYTDQYVKIGALTYDVYKFAKTHQQTRIEWLAENGFVWKETGYVELDMRSREVEKRSDISEAFAIADIAFRCYPLAGEYILTAKENELLYQSANQTVQKILKGELHLTKGEEIALVLETIELLKGWSTDLLEKEGVGTFWRYIFLQYGFNPDNSKSAEDRLYARFRLAIKNTLTRYKRFFAPEGTQRYYTSLLLHAMAPRQSIEALFNILFDFYVKNLDFQYAVEDISYKLFTRGMRTRWDRNISKDDDIQLRSDTVFSGLQALFRQRPGYMAVLCDSIVKKMDALLRGEETGTLEPDKNYWDLLLVEWYNKKSVTERIHAQGERRYHKAEYVATAAERIYVHYFLQEEKVGLFIPRIRLPKVESCRPIVRVYQNEVLIYEDEIAVIGNDLCLTTRSCFFPLEKTEYDFTLSPQLIVDISYKNEGIFQSGTALKRNYILFDAAGKDKSPKSGIAYLFASEVAVVEAPDYDGLYQCPHPGQLYRINLGEVSTLTINGTEAFVDGSASSQMRHHTSRQHLDKLHILDQGTYADIYDAPFEFILCLPEGENPLRYQTSVDGVRWNLDHLRKNGNEYVISVDQEGTALHRIRVIDISDDSVRYEYRYAILPGLSVKTDKSLYRTGVDEVVVTASWQEVDYTFNIPLMSDEKCVTFSIPQILLQFELELPSIRCEFMGKNAFQAPETVWYRDIDPGEFVTVQVPDNWTATLMLDGVPVSPAQTDGQFELGNEIRSLNGDTADRMLWLLLRNDKDQRENFKITVIIFKPKIFHDPLEIRDGILYWRIEHNFVGDEGAHFQIRYERPDGQILLSDVVSKDTDLGTVDSFPNGRYPYQVYLQKKSVFASTAEKQMLYDGFLLVGDLNEFSFEEKKLQLGNSLCWDFSADSLGYIYMRPGCGVIQNLVYHGKSIASGEQIPVPCYSGEMFFVDNYGRYRAFNSVESKEYEQINPVNVWIINDHLLILRCVTDDTVYVDIRYSTIVNRNPAMTMSRQEQKERLLTPDYFEYVIKEV